MVLGTAFGIASGVVVDTHVKRLSRRLGLISKNTPEQIERELMQVLPRSQWVDISHRLIHHGRRICLAQPALRVVHSRTDLPQGRRRPVPKGRNRSTTPTGRGPIVSLGSGHASVELSRSNRLRPGRRRQRATLS